MIQVFVLIVSLVSLVTLTLRLCNPASVGFVFSSFTSGSHILGILIIATLSCAVHSVECKVKTEKPKCYYTMA